MQYKSILAPVAGAPEDATVLSAAAGLAAEAGGSLTVFPAFPNLAAEIAALGASWDRAAAPEILDRIRASEGGTLAQLEALTQRVAAQHKARAAVAPRELLPAAALSRALTLADLAVFGGEAARRALAALFAEALIGSRAPVLVVNYGAGAPANAAIAWDGSAQAGRAVRAALPFLRKASAVFVLSNADDPDARERAGATSDALLEYLALHGVGNVTLRAVGGEKVGASLLRGAESSECGLLVAGAFGRPRMYELVLGGTTRALVGAAGGPNLLLAH